MYIPPNSLNDIKLGDFLTSFQQTEGQSAPFLPKYKRLGPLSVKQREGHNILFKSWCIQ